MSNSLYALCCIVPNSGRVVMLVLVLMDALAALFSAVSIVAIT